jgi:hypothetical protein
MLMVKITLRASRKSLGFTFTEYVSFFGEGT